MPSEVRRLGPWDTACLVAGRPTARAGPLVMGMPHSPAASEETRMTERNEMASYDYHHSRGTEDSAG